VLTLTSDEPPLTLKTSSLICYRLTCPLGDEITCCGSDYYGKPRVCYYGLAKEDVSSGTTIEVLGAT
jgi:hypothetical protein